MEQKGSFPKPTSSSRETSPPGKFAVKIYYAGPIRTVALQKRRARTPVLSKEFDDSMGELWRSVCNSRQRSSNQCVLVLRANFGSVSVETPMDQHQVQP